MSIALSKAFKEKIVESVSTKPLQKGEVRELRCLSGYILSLSDELDGNRYMFHLKINGVDVYVHRKQKYK